MTSITLGLAKPDEYDAIGELCALAYRADGQFTGEAGSYETTLRDVASRAAAAEVLAARDSDGTVLGTVTVCFEDSAYREIAEPRELEFRMLAVVPSAQGRGVGELLVRECFRLAAERECRRVVLCTRDDSAQAARRLYQRLGFERQAHRDWSSVAGIRLIAWQRPVEWRGQR